jgi:hypothetical protein
MDHDFVNDPNVGRVDSKGAACHNIGGVMDYFQPAFNKWSTCSVEDFQALYDAEVLSYQTILNN